MGKKANGLTIAYHYPITDPECHGDYYDVTVDAQINGMKYSIQYGDEYHDKGSEKAEGFKDAFQVIYGNKFPIRHIYLADREEL